MKAFCLLTLVLLFSVGVGTRESVARGRNKCRQLPQRSCCPCYCPAKATYAAPTRSRANPANNSGIGPPNYESVLHPALIAVTNKPSTSKIAVPAGKPLTLHHGLGSEVNFGPLTKTMQITVVNPGGERKVVYDYAVVQNHQWPGMENGKFVLTLEEGDLIEVRMMVANTLVANPYWVPCEHYPQGCYCPGHGSAGVRGRASFNESSGKLCFHWD
jgi:hypothetical protein